MPHKKRGLVSVPASAHHSIRKEAEVNALFYSIGEGAIVTNEHGRVSRINQKALELLGFKLYEILGKWYPEIVVAEDEHGKKILNFDRPITQVFITGKTISKRVFYRKKNGDRIGVALTVSPVLLNGIPIGAIEVFRDITEELLLEKARDEFIAIASHQLRTPATAVKQYSKMLLENYFGELTENQTEIVQKIYESNERELSIVNDLLRIAEVDSGKLQLSAQKVNLDSLLEKITENQQSNFSKHEQTLEYTADKKSKGYTVLADESRLRMAIENIIDNAGKYSHAGSTIKVCLGKRKDGSIILQVIDEGVGVAENDIEKMFEKFTRIENELSTEVGGSGLGLYWVKRILDMHGAKLRVKSVLGKGTTFTIHFKAIA